MDKPILSYIKEIEAKSKELEKFCFSVEKQYKATEADVAEYKAKFDDYSSLAKKYYYRLEAMKDTIDGTFKDLFKESLLANAVLGMLVGFICYVLFFDTLFSTILFTIFAIVCLTGFSAFLQHIDKEYARALLKLANKRYTKYFRILKLTLRNLRNPYMKTDAEYAEKYIDGEYPFHKLGYYSEDDTSLSAEYPMDYKMLMYYSAKAEELDKFDLSIY